MAITTLEQFYSETSAIVPPGIAKEIGHFNVFSIKETIENFKLRAVMPYNRRAYYKISLIRGRNRAEYADKVIEIEKNALLFATPKVPYHYVPQDMNQAGYFCIFTDEFLLPSKSGVQLDSLPIFRTGGYPVFQISEKQTQEINSIFEKMQKELASEYVYKYDLIRNYLLELIHYGQKLQPVEASHPAHNASARVSSLFVELLERQFPLDSAD